MQLEMSFFNTNSYQGSYPLKAFILITAVKPEQNYMYTELYDQYCGQLCMG
jgi:hypothetical protein